VVQRRVRRVKAASARELRQVYQQARTKERCLFRNKNKTNNANEVGLKINENMTRYKVIAKYCRMLRDVEQTVAFIDKTFQTFIEFVYREILVTPNNDVSLVKQRIVHCQGFSPTHKITIYIYGHALWQ
jgi:hypothetical protein